MRLVRGELQKLFTTRLWWVMLLSMLAYVGVSLGFFIGFAGQANSGLPARDTPAFLELIWGFGVGGTVFPMILGIVMMTGEYRYQTITSTFLTTPRRERVVAAKLACAAVIGLLFGLAVLLLTAAAVIPTVLVSGAEFAFSGSLARITAGVLGAMALYTLFGIGLGALIRNQIGAILAGVGWVFIVESLVNAIPPLQPIGKWTPAGAASALTSTVDIGQGTSYLLPGWAGALVLLAYGVVFSAVASATTLRRDVT